VIIIFYNKSNTMFFCLAIFRDNEVIEIATKVAHRDEGYMSFGASHAPGGGNAILHQQMGGH
jgi:hypothetical protein